MKNFIGKSRAVEQSLHTSKQMPTLRCREPSERCKCGHCNNMPTEEDIVCCFEWEEWLQRGGGPDLKFYLFCLLVDFVWNCTSSFYKLEAIKYNGRGPILFWWRSRSTHLHSALTVHCCLHSASSWVSCNAALFLSILKATCVRMSRARETSSLGLYLDMGDRLGEIMYYDLCNAN